MSIMPVHVTGRAFRAQRSRNAPRRGIPNRCHMVAGIDARIVMHASMQALQA
ncbi:hypothetical protein PU630_01515 [Microbacterium horticulturae]|uniref:Uncharacterized protein n=1 Tax=Microbacterium horticulturae TaxID=3028316 RepID=A0ABY8BYH8_9MICO|nr:hypothetical protein [Microbacterium sp. KACC 23027]WEG09266.1 hypothetical protein PU630_01515 [Microbacterium sp. KACC 23027]